MFDPPQKSFPVSAFEQLVPALANVLKAVHDGSDSADEPQHRQAVAQAVGFPYVPCVTVMISQNVSDG